MNQPERYKCDILQPDDTKVKFVKDVKKNVHSVTYNFKRR